MTLIAPTLQLFFTDRLAQLLLRRRRFGGRWSSRRRAAGPGGDHHGEPDGENRRDQSLWRGGAMRADTEFMAGATAAPACTGGPRMMYWDGNMGGWGYALMVISFVLFWGAVIAAIVLLARAVGPGNRSHDPASGAGYAENLLAERFARGEIDENEYTARLNILRRGPRR
ncbi:hypothetical protein [Arthrobacter sp. UYCo732]|uniref:SHOCT domain-containing protein n=1 Tax=Arthrobacter sp. UYCo732 TaxID=3156336 RepID=UPI0033972388